MSSGGSPELTIRSNTSTINVDHVARRHRWLSQGADTVTNAADAAIAEEVGNIASVTQPRLIAFVSSMTPRRSAKRDSISVSVQDATFIAKTCIPHKRN